MTLQDAIIDLYQERTAQGEQWSELFAALALAQAMPDEGTARIDLLSHAADLEYELLGSSDTIGAILEPLDPNDEIASAARGRDALRRLSDALDGDGDDS